MNYTKKAEKEFDEIIKHIGKMGDYVCKIEDEEERKKFAMVFAASNNAKIKGSSVSIPTTASLFGNRYICEELFSSLKEKMEDSSDRKEVKDNLKKIFDDLLDEIL